MSNEIKDWVLVPREPSAEMLDAAIDAHIGFDGEDEVDAVWAAMLAAAPTPPAEAQVEGGDDVATLRRMRSDLSILLETMDRPDFARHEAIEEAKALDYAIAALSAQPRLEVCGFCGKDGKHELTESCLNTPLTEQASAPVGAEAIVDRLATDRDYSRGEAVDDLREALAQQPAARRQYFYRINDCLADGSREPDCICWHDEGTGPLAGGTAKTWRDVPAQPPAGVDDGGSLELRARELLADENERAGYEDDAEWLRKNGAVCQGEEMALAAIVAALSAQPRPDDKQAAAWVAGYKSGVLDEQTSAANVGIAGLGGKVGPARENPYGKTRPASAPVGVDELAQIIREVDGKHSLGAGALAEAILGKFPALAQQPAAPDDVARLVEALRLMIGAATPVATEIDARGHTWSEAYLDQALPTARAALAQPQGASHE